MSDRREVARWESRTGKHWVTLYRDAYGYGYSAPDAGGSFGQMADDATAVQLMQARVDSGYFLPDDAKTPMKRAK